MTTTSEGRGLRRRKLLSACARGLLAAAILCASAVSLQDILIFPGVFIRRASGPRDARSLPAGVESEFVVTADGRRIEVWRLGPHAGVGTKTAVLVHGNGEVLDEFISVQRWISRLGYSTYAFDYRGFGLSSGWPSERGIYRDVEAVFAEALRRDGTEAAQSLVLGRSIGAGPAAYLAARYQPAILVLLSPYLSIPEVVRGMDFYRHFTPLLWYRFPTEEYMQQLQGTCVVLAHGEKDTIIPAAHTRKLAQGLRGKLAVQVVMGPDVGHDDLLLQARIGVDEAIRRCAEERQSS